MDSASLAWYLDMLKLILSFIISKNYLFIYIVQPMHISNPETIKDLTGMFSNI